MKSVHNPCIIFVRERHTYLGEIRSFKRQEVVTGDKSNELWWCRNIRGKILLLYKSYKNRYDGWVLPKGTVEQGETHEQTALREVKEETDADASIIKYVGKSEYSFYSFHEQIIKSVHWYLMESENYHSKPQKEEFFVDSGYYKFHEAYHLLKFPNEKEILKQAYDEYKKLRSANRWGKKTR